MTSKVDILKTAIGAAYPVATPLAQEAGWLERRWVVRTKRVFEDWELSTVAEEFKATLADAPELETLQTGTASYPVVELVKFAPQHCVAVVRFPDKYASQGNEGAFMNWGVLRELDARVGIEDLQGIPRQHWRALTM